MKQVRLTWERFRAWGDLRRGPLSFWLVWAAIVWRYLSCGLTYCWQHDDYIQYINYPSVDDYGALMRSEGLLASRPLAVIFDLYFWQHFAGAMIVAVLLLALLYAGSALLWQRVLHRRFGTGWLFTVIYALIPLAIEGTYWLSAGTRLICGLFFTALSAWLLCIWIEEGKRWAAIAYFPVLLLSYGHYEQTLVLSVTISLLLMLDVIGERNARSRRGLLALLTFVGAACYFGFTAVNAGTGALATRLEIAWPVGPWYYRVFLPEIGGQIYDAFIGGGFGTVVKGFVRGCGIIFAEGKWLWLLVCLGITVLFGRLVWRADDAEAVALPADKHRTGRIVWAYAFGMLLALAPVSIFFFIANPWFSIRNTLPSLVGLAFLADLTVRLCLRRQVRARAILCAALVLVFSVGSVSEMQDYRDTYDHDVIFLDVVAEKLEAEADTLPAGKVGILGANASYLPDQNFYFNGHISGITSSDWELYGALTARTKRAIAQTPVPLPTNESFLYRGWNRALRDIASFDVLWFWDETTHTIRDLRAEQQSDGSWRLCFADDGSFCARVWEELASNGEWFGYLRFSE